MHMYLFKIWQKAIAEIISMFVAIVNSVLLWEKWKNVAHYPVFELFFLVKIFSVTFGLLLQLIVNWPNISLPK